MLITGTVDTMKEDLIKLGDKVEQKIKDLDASVPLLQQKISTMEATISFQVTMKIILLGYYINRFYLH
jgi:hypothetical protein